MATWEIDKAKSWISSLWDKIRAWVLAGEELAKAEKEKKTSQYFADRQKVTNDITSWKISSWNKAQDTMTVRMNNITDLFAAYALEKWADPDKVTAMTKNPNEIIKRLKSKWEDQAKAIDEYLMKWWYADRYFDYAVWKTENPYEKYEKRNHIPTTANITLSAVSTPVQTAAWLLDIAWQWIDKISTSLWWRTQNEKDLDNFNKLISSISNEDYNKYKNWDLEWNWFWQTWWYKAEYPNYDVDNQTFVNAWLISRAWFYKEYDKAVENWFDWDVEDYANYKYNVANKISRWISEATTKYLQDNVYDPNQPWAWVWKFVWEVWELLLAPEYKWVDLVSKFPKAAKRLIKLVKWWSKTAVWWLEFQALDDAYHWELSWPEQYALSSVLNMATAWILEWINKTPMAQKFIRWLGSPSEASQTAIWTKTLEEWNNMSKISQNAAKDYNAEITPRTEIANKLKQIKEELTKKRIIKWEKLEKTEQDLKFNKETWEKYDANDMLKEIEAWFRTLWDASKKHWAVWGENAKYPKFFEDWKTLMSEETKNTLNSYSRNENWAIVKLWDEIEKLWNDVFVMTDRKVNATTSKEFFDGLKWILKEQWWSKRWKWIKIMKDVFNTIEEKFTNALSKKSREALWTAKWEAKEAINLDMLFDDFIWRLDNKVVSSKAAQWAEKAVQWDEARRELFKAIKKYTDDHIDMNNEIWAWVTNMAIYDPEYARKLAETIYPSAPWMYEFLIKNILWWLKKQVSQTYTKDFRNWEWARWAWGAINNAVWKWKDFFYWQVAPRAWWAWVAFSSPVNEQ